MLLNIAKQLFENGVITSIQAIQFPMAQDGWSMLITTKNGEQTYLYTSKGEPKIYLKMDSLLNDVNRITGLVKLVTFTQ